MYQQSMFWAKNKKIIKFFMFLQSLKSKYSNARFRNAVSTHQDPVEAVQRIAEFVGKDLSKQLIVQIAEKCSFKNLSTADEHLKQNVTITTLADPGKFGTSEMYRKGNKSAAGCLTLTMSLLNISLNFQT